MCTIVVRAYQILSTRSLFRCLPVLMEYAVQCLPGWERHTERRYVLYCVSVKYALYICAVHMYIVYSMLSVRTYVHIPYHVSMLYVQSCSVRMLSHTSVWSVYVCVWLWCTVCAYFQYEELRSSVFTPDHERSFFLLIPTEAIADLLENLMKE